MGGAMSVGRPGAWARGLRQLVALALGLALLATGAGLRARPAAAPLVDVIVQKAHDLDRWPEQAVRRLGGTVGHELWIVNGFAARLPKSAVSALESVPGVVNVTPNRTVQVHGQYGAKSGVASAVYTDVTKASKAWSVGATGQGINVALIDTGVNTEGDLAGKVLHAEDFTPEQDYQDNYGHGTFVAGLIAGSGANSAGAVMGEAPDAKIVSVKIAGRDGSTDVTRLLAALEWVVTNKDAYGIRVLNLSIGTDSNQSYRIDPLNFAVERVWNSGIVVVVAAGNHGTAPGSVSKPGDDPFVITVGSSDDHTTDSQKDDTLAPFSGVGPTATDGVAKPDVLAPGKSVVSTRSPGSTIDISNPLSEIGSTYFKGSGTSFSAAIVSGEAALILSRNWSLNPNQVKRRITSYADLLPGVPASAQGVGVINASDAVAAKITSEANQGIAPAVGGGSLQATRGSGALWNPDGSIMTDDQANAAVGFDPTQYFGSQWAGSQWNGSQWNGSQWAGSQWNGSQWNGSQWAGSQWNGSQWAGSQWAGSQWAGSQWAGSQWAGSQWAGSQWNGSQWNGSQWNGSQWNGSQWNGSQWNGLEWSGSQWY